jgi:hypothetical protein
MSEQKEKEIEVLFSPVLQGHRIYLKLFLDYSMWKEYK